MLLWNNIRNLDRSKEQNTIKGIINVENNDYNKNIFLFNLETNYNLDVYINNKKIIILRDINPLSLLGRTHTQDKVVMYLMI